MRTIRREGYDPSRLLLEETLFHTANGYVGVRASFDEGYGPGLATIRGTYINALYDTHEIRHPEKLHGFPETGERIVSVTDAQDILLFAEGQPIHVGIDNGASLIRELDLERGVALRSFETRTIGGALLRFEFRRFCSQVVRELFCVGLRVSCLEGRTSLKVVFRLEGAVANHFDESDPRLSGSAWRSLEVRAVSATIKTAPEGQATIGGPGTKGGGQLSVESVTKGTRFGLAVLSSIEGPAEAGWSAKAGEEAAELCMCADLAAGQSIELTRKNIYADSIRHGEAMKGAEAIAASIAGLDCATLEAAHAARVASFWEEAAVEVEGEDEVDEGLQFGLFELLQSAPKDERSNIPAKGLSGEGYEGHYFWDTEIYLAPFFTWTAPELAKPLLSYRHSILDAARAHAKRMGQRRGAAFPWRTIAGRECSAYYPSGSAQYHINADIAYSLWRHWEATGDLDFLADIAAELLFETARTWLDIGHFDGGRFLIESVTGPDEYTCLVDNNFYTNAMARFNLERAVATHRLLAAARPGTLSAIAARIGLEDAELADWERAAKAMYLPYEAERDITPQDDGFLKKARWDPELLREEDRPLLLHYHHLAIIRRQVCKQADAVLAHFLLPDSAAESTIRNSYDYYEAITTHDSSLSYTVFSAMAARLGDAEKAWRYFREGVRLDLDDRHGNAKDGIHAANMGGAWLALVFGFGGFRPERGLPSFAPVLPAAWRSYSFRIVWRGSSIRAKIRREAGGEIGADLELAAGPALEVELYGRKALLSSSLEGRRP
ncbi:MAG TPA: glycosyl hydrolase family 65 protein [Rectinemataceae bacterium]|nr:glycosyl hydrolase family 65 protein [Rectinemataceae bacterium]